MKMANEHQDSLGVLSFWTDRSKLENQRVGSGVSWQSENGKRNTRKIYLGTNKEVFDAELYRIDQVSATRWLKQ